MPQSAIARLAVFAYNRETREPIWQSGIAKAESDCRSTWILGAGPFQRGSIYEGYRFAGRNIRNESSDQSRQAAVGFEDEYLFPERPFIRMADTAPARIRKRLEESGTKVKQPAGHLFFDYQHRY